MKTLSVHGLQQLHRDAHIHCAVWLVAFLLSSTALFYQLYCGICTVMEEPLETDIEISYEPTNFPVITVCNLNPFKRDALLSVYKNLTNTTQINTNPVFRLKRALPYTCPPITNTTSYVLPDIGNCNNCFKMGSGCYISSPNKMIKADALTYCMNAGGQLPFFQNKSEYDSFISFVNCSFHKTSILLDYINTQTHNGTNPGLWRNVNGTGTTGYTTWQRKEPIASNAYMAGYVGYSISLWITKPATSVINTVCQCKANCNASFIAIGSSFFWNTQLKHNWTAARSFCNSVGARLTSFDSNQDFVDWNAFMIAYAAYSYTFYWLDYTNNNTHSPWNAGVWVNSNGTATSISNWYWEPLGKGSVVSMAWNVNGWMDNSRSDIYDITCTCPVVSNALTPVCITNATSNFPPVTGPDCSNCSQMGNSCFLTPDNGETVSGPNAQYICQTLGGHLPTFQTAADWIDFTNYLSCTNKQYVLLGYQNTVKHNSSNIGNWVDSYGNLTTQSFWFGEPLGRGGCVLFSNGLKDYSNWENGFMDTSCSAKNTIICQCKGNISCAGICYTQNTNCFFNKSATANYTVGQTYCASLGGQLMQIDSPTDLADLIGYMKINILYYTLLGYINSLAHNQTNPGIWQTATGKVAQYLNWYKEPFGDGSCAFTSAYLPNNYQWIDSSCNSVSFNTVCKCSLQTTTSTTTSSTTTSTTTTPTATSTTSTTATSTTSTTTPTTTTTTTTTTTPATTTTSASIPTRTSTATFQTTEPTIKITDAQPEVAAYALTALSDEQLAEIGYSFEQSFISCVYNNRICSNDFTMTVDRACGNCFSFNFGNNSSNILKANRAGSSHGLAFLFNLNAIDSYPSSQENVGLKVIVTDQNSPLFPDSEGNNLSPGTDAEITISMAEFQRLNAVSSKCQTAFVSNNSDFNRYGFYHPEGCFRSLAQNAIVAKCNCAYPFYRKPQNVSYCSIEQKPCVDDFFTNDAVSLQQSTFTSCLNPCSENQFRSRLSSTNLRTQAYCFGGNNDCPAFYRTNVIKVEANIQSLRKVILSETQSYPVNRLLSDFGGQLGICLGMSLISIVELFFWIPQFISHKCSK